MRSRRTLLASCSLVLALALAHGCARGALLDDTADTGGQGGAETGAGGMSSGDATGVTSATSTSADSTSASSTSASTGETSSASATSASSSTSTSATTSSSTSGSTSSSTSSGGGPVCGDGKCDSGETCSTCAKDCGACPTGCTHDVCEVGGVLDSSCDTCVDTVCFFDDYCCSTAWDSDCVDTAIFWCGKTCP